MTGSDGPGPDLALLADLDAGLLDADRAAAVRAAAAADPDATAMLQALATTRAELAALPEPPVPAWARDRWAAALAAATPGAPDSTNPDSTNPDDADAHADRSTVDAHLSAHPPGMLGERISKAGPRFRPPRRPRAAVLAAALLVAIVGGSLLRPAPDGARVSGAELAGAGRSAVGATDLGTLADPVRRADCLRAVAVPGVPPDTPVLGGRRVELDGHPGVLLVVTTGERGVFRAVVVDPECGPAGGTLLDSAVIGR